MENLKRSLIHVANRWQRLERTRSSRRRRTQHVRVDHGGTDVAVAQQLLDPSNVNAGVEQVRGKRMTQGMCGDFLWNLRQGHGTRDRPPDRVFVLVMPALN